MTTEPKTPVHPVEEIRTVLKCDDCEVTWRGHPGAPCWFCDNPGHVVSPERLVLD